MLDNTTKPIEHYIRRGLSERFYKVFAAPLLFYNGVDVKKVSSEMLSKRGLPQYPFAVAKTKGWALTEQTFKPNTLLRRGIKSRSSDDYVLAMELNLTPITTTYEVTFYTQDFQSASEFGKQWLFALVRGNLKYSVTFAVLDADIDVELGADVQVPELADGTSEQKEYAITVEMSTRGYMSDPLKTSQAALQVDLEVQALESLGKQGGSVALFQNSWPRQSKSSSLELDPLAESNSSYVFTQSDPSSVWVINHNLRTFPQVTVVDSRGLPTSSTVYFPTDNQIIVTFPVLTSGKAYLS